MRENSKFYNITIKENLIVSLGGDFLNKDNARKIILNAVSTSEPLWNTYGIPWDEIDQRFIQRGYEQGGFECWIFTESLDHEGIYSIERLGRILNKYTGKTSYNREFAGSLESTFYTAMKQGLCGEEGEKFVRSVESFHGGKGGFFWSELWRMLVCCNYLKNNYRSSFSYYLKKKYADYKGLSGISDDDFKKISSSEWEDFKIKVKPWNELYGVGENVFDFIMGDIIGFKFVENSFKLDLANKHFFRVTGIFDHSMEREEVLDYLIDLDLPYTLREINKGLYAYCSVTEQINCGFCRNPDKCKICNANDICEKNF